MDFGFWTNKMQSIGPQSTGFCPTVLITTMPAYDYYYFLLTQSDNLQRYKYNVIAKQQPRQPEFQPTNAYIN